MATKEIGVLGHISLKVTIVVVLAVLAVGIILLHILLPCARKEIEFALAVIGGATAVYAGYYTARSIRINSERNKKASSFEMLAPLNKTDMTQIRAYIENSISRTNVSPDQLYDEIKKDRGLYSAIILSLGIYEDISIGIQKDFLDEDVLFQSLGFIVPLHFYGLQHFISQERKVEKDLYCETEKLAMAWRANKSLATNKEYK